MRIVYPCVQYPQNIICYFGNYRVNGIYLRSEQQFLCVTPEFRDHTTGKVPFNLTFTDSHGERTTLRSSFYKSKSLVYCIILCPNTACILLVCVLFLINWYKYYRIL